VPPPVLTGVSVGLWQPLKKIIMAKLKRKTIFFIIKVLFAAKVKKNATQFKCKSIFYNNHLCVIEEFNVICNIILKKEKMEKSGFPPLIDNNTEIIVLGTMPGDKSIRTGEYYANPTNQFWKLIFQIFNSGIPVFNYEEKSKLLLKNKIGLWDVLSKAHRHGSLDSNIQNEEFNDFEQLFNNYPNIKILVFNGQKSSEYYFRTCNMPTHEKQYFILPSTSSANTTKTFNVKLKEWSKVLTKSKNK
jgi:hypoxanthine-DNA glycosylase